MLELPLEVVREIVMRTNSLNDFINVLTTCRYIRSAINDKDINKKINMYASFVTKSVNVKKVNIEMTQLPEFIRVQTLSNGKLHGKYIWFARDDQCTIIKMIGSYSKGIASGTWRFHQGKYSADIVYR